MTDAVNVEIAANGLVIRPGDTLLLVANGYLSDDFADMIGKQLREKMPGLAEVVIADGFSTVAVYRPEAENPGGDQ